jgi:hypothetical protein
MTRGKILLLILVAFALVWVALLVLSVRHVIAMSDLANQNVAPHLPTVQTFVKTAPAPPLSPYPEERIVQALPRQWETTDGMPRYAKQVLAENPEKGRAGSTTDSPRP